MDWNSLVLFCGLIVSIEGQFRDWDQPWRRQWGTGDMDRDSIDSLRSRAPLRRGGVSWDLSDRIDDIQGDINDRRESVIGDTQDTLRDVLDSVNDVVDSKRGRLQQRAFTGLRGLRGLVEDGFDRISDIRDNRRDRANDIIENVRDGVGNLADRMQDRRENIAENIRNVRENIADNVRDVVSENIDEKSANVVIDLRSNEDRFDSGTQDDRRDKVDDKVDDARDRIETVIENVRDHTDDNMHHDDHDHDHHDHDHDHHDDNDDDDDDDNDDDNDNDNDDDDKNDDGTDWLEEIVEKELDNSRLFPNEFESDDDGDDDNVFEFWEMFRNSGYRNNPRSRIYPEFLFGGNSGRRRATTAILSQLFSRTTGRFGQRRNLPGFGANAISRQQLWYPRRYPTSTQVRQQQSQIAGNRLGSRIQVGQQLRNRFLQNNRWRFDDEDWRRESRFREDRDDDDSDFRTGIRSNRWNYNRRNRRRFDFRREDFEDRDERDEIERSDIYRSRIGNRYRRRDRWDDGRRVDRLRYSNREWDDDHDDRRYRWDTSYRRGRRSDYERSAPRWRSRMRDSDDDDNDDFERQRFRFTRGRGGYRQPRYTGRRSPFDNATGSRFMGGSMPGRRPRDRASTYRGDFRTFDSDDRGSFRRPFSFRPPFYRFR